MYDLPRLIFPPLCDQMERLARSQNHIQANANDIISSIIPELDELELNQTSPLWKKICGENKDANAKLKLGLKHKGFTKREWSCN